MSDSSVKLLQCYNKGCSQMYEESKNHEEACLFHPGDPFFHDAYKGWSCCKKKCTDFTEFLNIKGCTRSFHSNVKPPEPERPKVDKSTKDEVIIVEAPKAPQRAPRPSEDLPTTVLPVTIASSLQQLLDKQRLENSTQSEKPSEKSSSVVKVGTSCKNGGCKATYEGEASNLTQCIYHPGVPIFHEGLKYWSCCQRKTTEFSNFLEQEGCQTGSHVWLKKEDTATTNTSCRYDWHQTGSYVFVTVYAKEVNPKTSSVKTNPVKLQLSLTFGENKKFEKEFILNGTIDVDNSSVTMSATKVEIKLKKSDFFSWDKLDIPRTKEIVIEDKTEQTEIQRVEHINLDDIDLRSKDDDDDIDEDF